MASPFVSGMSLPVHSCRPGRTCLVTGGTKGIGRAVVEEMGGLGARVYTCARSAADLEELLAHSKAQGWDVQGCVADVSKAEDRQRLVAAVSEAFGGQLQVLFNNVGTNIRKPTQDYTQVGGRPCGTIN